MKEKFKHLIKYNEVDTNSRLRLDSLFSLLQYAAVTHSENVGAGTKVLVEKGYTWVLGKIGIEILKLPTLGEEVILNTWSLGANGFTALRDFEVKGVAKATSIWYFIDVERKKPLKVPEDIIARYNSLKLAPNFPDLKSKKFYFEHNDFFTYNITLRYSDFDSNKHVNNTVYFNLLQTALFRKHGFVPFLSNISCHFVHEIPVDIKNVDIDIYEYGSEGSFRIRSHRDFCTGIFSGDLL